MTVFECTVLLRFCFFFLFPFSFHFLEAYTYSDCDARPGVLKGERSKFGSGNSMADGTTPSDPNASWKILRARPRSNSVLTLS